MASALVESLKTLLRGLYRTYAPPSYTGVELLRSDGQKVDAVEPVGEHPSEIPEWQAALIAEFCAEASATGGEPAISNHSQLDWLDYERSGHLGFASAVDLADHVGSSSGVHGSTSTPTASAIPQATVLGKLDGWISDAAAGVKGLLQLAGDIGGTAVSPRVVGLTEAAGPTNLALGAIADGEFLKRSGNTVVGGAASGGGQSLSLFDFVKGSYQVQGDEGPLALGQFRFDPNWITPGKSIKFCAVGAVSEATNTGTLLLYNLTDGEAVTGASLAITGSLDYSYQESAALVVGAAAGNLKNVAKVYEVRISTTGGDPSDLLTLTSAYLEVY